MPEHSEKIKVIVILSRIIIGGPANFVELYASHLPKDKYKIILVGGGVSEGELNKAQVLKEKGIDVHLIDIMKRDLSVFNDLFSIYKLYKFIKKEKPDIVSTHTAKAGAIGRIAARIARVPVILHTFHGHTFQYYFSPVKTEFYKMVERLLSRISTKIIAISPLQQYDLVEKFKIAPANKIKMVPIAIDTKKFQYIQKNNDFKNELGIPVNDFTIGMIARLVPIKNHQMIFKVLKKLHNIGIKAHLLIVGDGETGLRNELLKQSNDLQLSSYVHFTGWMLNVEKVYASMNVLALTSLNEGTPVSIIEAMAASVPVVATNVGGVKDLLLENCNGLLCNSNDPDDMVNKIMQLMDDPALERKIVDNGRKFVEDNYDYKGIVDQIDHFQTELLKKYYAQ